MDKSGKRTIVVFSAEFHMGGTETLILRLLNWYNQRGHRTVLLTFKPVTNVAILKDFDEATIEHYQFNPGKKDFFYKEEKLSFQRNEDPLVINNFLPEFFICFGLLKNSKYKCRFTWLLYIVHPFAATSSKKLRSFTKRMIHCFLQKKIMVFMDEICIGETLALYKLNGGDYDLVIDRLPIKIEEAIVPAKVNSNRESAFKILTIARFDFPFKGYILGLVQTFKNLYAVNENISLTIIGYGKDKSELDQVLSALPAEARKKVFILDQIPYSEIKAQVSDCDIFVGMGTTVLDAANQEKIVIVAYAYQTENFTSGFFHDDYTKIGQIFKAAKNNQTFDELLLNAIEMNPDDFYNYSKKSKQLLTEHYNIDKIADRLQMQPLNAFNLNQKIIIHTACLLNNLAGDMLKFFKR